MSAASGTVVLTGPTGGLASRLVPIIAAAGPRRLVLLGRSAAAMQPAAATAREAGAGAVVLVETDLADLASVSRAGDRIRTEALEADAPVGSMVLAAGVQLADRDHVSAQGIELTFAVNVVAQHQLLRSALPATAPGAVVTMVSSGTHFGDWHSYGMVATPRWDEPAVLARPGTPGDRAHGDAGSRAYATSKLASVILVHGWAARHGEQIRINAFDPGLMPGTGLARALPRPAQWAWKHVLPAFTFLPGWSTPARSARHLGDLALGRTHPGLAGGYVELGRERRSSPESYDAAHQVRLWDELQALTTGPDR